MKVMKRYCDFDYDNNTIILFDATDGEAFDDLNITWISSGSVTEKASAKSEPEKEPKKEKMVPLPQYIEHQYRKKVQMEKERVLQKYRLKQQRHAAQLQHAAMYSLNAAQMANARAPPHARSVAFAAAQRAKAPQMQPPAMNPVMALEANYQKMMHAHLQNVQQLNANANAKYMAHGANPRVLPATHSLYSR